MGQASGNGGRIGPFLTYTNRRKSPDEKTKTSTMNGSFLLMALYVGMKFDPIHESHCQGWRSVLVWREAIADTAEASKGHRGITCSTHGSQGRSPEPQREEQASRPAGTRYH